MKMYRKGKRKDGKVKVIYQFPLTGVSIPKIITEEQWEADWGKAENNPANYKRLK
jgi:hypothetical protein